MVSRWRERCSRGPKRVGGTKKLDNIRPQAYVRATIWNEAHL